jgi:hypothetical protein
LIFLLSDDIAKNGRISLAINLSVFFAIFSAETEANANEFGILLKEKNRLIFCN